MNKKKKTGFRMLCVAVSALLLTPLFGSYALADGDILTDRVEHTDENFEDFEYVRLEESEFDAIIAGLSALTQDAANQTDVLDVITEMEDFCCEMGGYYTIAYIYTTLDASNEAYDEELKYYDELQTNVYDKVMQSYHTVAVSPCGDALKERIDDEDEWQEILDYEPMTQEQKDLSAKETELSLKYDDLYNESYTTVISGSVYDADGLEDAYSNGTIGFNQYLEGLAEITTNRNQALGELYLELVDVRTQIARSYGYDNYADYAYEKVYDRDYAPEDLTEYRSQVKEYMVPLQDELYELLFDEYGDEFSEVYDQEITAEECLDLLGQYLPEISDGMLVPYQYMVDHNLCDLSVDEKKAPGGYTTSIQMYNAPFLFNCADGNYFDMETLIHEFGHYNQMYYASEDAWYYGSSDLDLAEINSQGLEALFLDYSEEIYGEYGEVMNLYSIFNQVYSCISGCKEDAFQYAVYQDPDDLTIEKLNQLYYEISLEYDDYDMYNSYYLGLYGMCEEDSIYEWVEIPHTFQSPMYYISYSVSMSAVEELLDVILDDREQGIQIYLELAKAGADDSFQDTLENVGLNNPITTPRFEVYAENIRQLVGLSDAASGSVVTDLDDAYADDASDDFVLDDDTVDWNYHSNNTLTVVIVIFIVTIIVLLAVLAAVIAILASNRAKKEAEAVKQSAGYAGYGNAPGANGMAPGNYGAAPGSYGAAPGNYGAAQGSYGTAPGGYGTVPENYGAAQGGYGTQPSGYGMGVGANGAAPGNYGAAPGNYGAAPGTNGTMPGNYAAMPSGYGTPQYGNGMGMGANANGAALGGYGAALGTNGSVPTNPGAAQDGYGMQPSGNGMGMGANAKGAAQSSYGAAQGSYGAAPGGYGTASGTNAMAPGSYEASQSSYGIAPDTNPAAPFGYGTAQTGMAGTANMPGSPYRDTQGMDGNGTAGNPYAPPQEVKETDAES